MLLVVGATSIDVFLAYRDFRLKTAKSINIGVRLRTRNKSPREDVDVTFVVDQQLCDARLTFARGNVQRRQTIFHEIYVGA